MVSILGKRSSKYINPKYEKRNIDSVVPPVYLFDITTKTEQYFTEID